MQPVLERGSIEIYTRWFDTTQFHIYQAVHLIQATFQSNSTEGLHFGAFHYYYGSFPLITIRSSEYHLNVTCKFWYLIPHEYYMILPALGISVASFTTI